MKFITDSPLTYRSVNNKGKKMNDWILTFTHILLPDELSRDAFIESIHAKASMLDREYPRTIPLHVSISNHDDGCTRIEVYPNHNPDKSVFILHVYLVRGEFRFSESTQLRLEGGTDAR